MATALTLPLRINTDDSDVEPLSESDFVDTEEMDHPMEQQPNPIHIRFFMEYVKLCEVMGRVLSPQISPTLKRTKAEFVDLTKHDIALANWLHDCPYELNWERSRHHFWSALLHLYY